jgi:aminotransferase EvaB
MTIIKYWDYLREYNQLRPKIIKSINNVFKSGKLFFGSELKKFEKKFCNYNNSKFGLGVANGTDALIIALKSFGVGDGDEVITVANTAIPTVAAIVAVGAIPIFVDVGNDYLIDVNKIERRITKKTKVIIPVHLYGLMCDMEKIFEIAKKYRLKIIEDSAQSCGALFKKAKSGTIGDAGCYSFYPTKILGSYGDAGFIIFKKKKYFEKAKRLRFYGLETEVKHSKWYNKYYSLESGLNSRLGEIQSTILNLKIKYLDIFIKKRQKISGKYFKYLKNLKLKLPTIYKDRLNVFHIFPILCKNRDEVIRKAKAKNIMLNINYPIPIHKMKAYKKYVCKNCNCLRNTERFSKELISLPIYPSLRNIELFKIILELKKILKNN